MWTGLFDAEPSLSDVGREMSYETAKEALRDNLEVMLKEPAKNTPQDYLIYNFSTALAHLIEALQADVAEIKAKIDQFGEGPPPLR